ALFGWLTNGGFGEPGLRESVLPGIVQGFLAASKTTDPKEWARLVREHGLSWEMLPDAALGERTVWDAILDKGIPATALMRQLSRLTRLGVIGPLGAGRTAEIAALLQDETRLKKGRVHPISVLFAHKTYANGTGRQGRDWTPVTVIVDA